LGDISGDGQTLLVQDIDHTYLTANPVAAGVPSLTDPLALSATPITQTVGNHVTLLGTLKDSATGAPVPDTLVHFQVMSGPDTGFTAIVRTDATGTAGTTLQGKAPGSDLVQAWVDGNINGALDADEASAATTVTWALSPTGRYVALGDSYSSGEGAVDSSGDAALDPNTNIKNQDQCHRSAHAYPELVKQDGAPSGETFVFQACSGALMADLVTDVGGPGQWSEGPQIDALNRQTSLITLSIGGNDLGFADGLNSCITGLGQNWLFPHTESGCLKTMQRLGDQGLSLVTLGGSIRIDKRDASWQFCKGDCKPDNGNFVSHTVPRLTSIFQLLHSQAPGARIRVMLYPHLFPASPPEKCVVGQFSASAVTHSYTLKKGAMEKFNGFVDQLDEAIVGQIKLAQKRGIDIDWADPRAEFEGHGVRCISNEAQSTSDPWINGAIIDGEILAPGLAHPSPFSFHPNATGQAHFAAALRGKL
jgi:hypothetical protein